jgi:hypothetical protein
MDCDEAVKTRVVHLRKVLSASDIQQLNALYAKIRREEATAADSAIVAAAAEGGGQGVVNTLRPHYGLASGAAGVSATSTSIKWLSGRHGPVATAATPAQLADHCVLNFSHQNLAGLRGSAHIMAFLQQGNRIATELPDLMSKILGVMRGSDRWNLLAPANGGQVRVCEYHEYTSGGEVGDPKHRDSGSLGERIACNLPAQSV